MPDKLMRAQVTIPLDGGVPEDYITNTFYFDGDEDLDGLATDADYHTVVMAQLVEFYGIVDTHWFPNSVAPEATVKIFDMRDPEIRVPEFVDTFVLTPKASLPMPNEVALCLSFQATRVSGSPQPRRRGRIFLGPIANDAETISVIGGQARPSLTQREFLVVAAEQLKQADLPIGIGGSVRWAIYSPTTDAGATIDDSFHDVDNGWIDDAFDTQRRRGPAPTARLLFA